MNQTSATNRWYNQVSWLGSQFNNIRNMWRPSAVQTNKDHHSSHKSEYNSIKNNQNIKQSKNQNNCERTTTDPKLEVLSKLRQGNLQQIFQNKIKKVSEYLQKKQQNAEKPDDLKCPICLQFLIKPVITHCGHNFCLRCIDETLLFKADCPNCRNSLRGTKIIQCQSLSKLILRIIQKYSQDQIDLYNQCLIQANQWVESRSINLNNLSINNKIDVKDTQFIWCKATIQQIYYKQNVVSAIKVHYEGWNLIYDEVIQVNSDRLASYGFYTTRQSIPQYRSILNGNDLQQQRMYSYVINNNQQEIFSQYVNPVQLPFGMGGVSGSNNFLFYNGNYNNMNNNNLSISFDGDLNINLLENIEEQSNQSQVSQPYSAQTGLQLQLTQQQFSFNQNVHPNLFQPQIDQFQQNSRDQKIDFQINRRNRSYEIYNFDAQNQHQNSHSSMSQMSQKKESKNYSSNLFNKINDIQLQVKQYNVNITNLLSQFNNNLQSLEQDGKPKTQCQDILQIKQNSYKRIYENEDADDEYKEEFWECFNSGNFYWQKCKQQRDKKKQQQQLQFYASQEKIQVKQFCNQDRNSSLNPQKIDQLLRQLQQSMKSFEFKDK